MMLNSKVLVIISVAMLLIVLGVDYASASNHLSSETSAAIGKGMIAGDDILKSFPNPTQKEVTISAIHGSSTLGCADTAEGCFTPKETSVALGDKIIFSNTDTAAHTFTAGTAELGPSGEFDSSLVSAGDSYEWTPTTEGKIPYFCMLHPWMTGLIVVGDGTHIPPTDTDPPETIILSGPLEKSTSDVATFRFSSDENNVSFRCSLDGSSIFSACSSPHEISKLGNGVHTLYIKAVDVSNNEDPSPSTHIWEIMPNEPEGNDNYIILIIIVVVFTGGIGVIIMIVKQKKKNGKSRETPPKDIEPDYSFDDSKLK